MAQPHSHREQRKHLHLLRIGRKLNLVLTLLGMIFFNLVSAITTEYAVYVLARFDIIATDYAVYELAMLVF